jgi:hypothetical protein
LTNGNSNDSSSSDSFKDQLLFTKRKIYVHQFKPSQKNYEKTLSTVQSSSSNSASQIPSIQSKTSLIIDSKSQVKTKPSYIPHSTKTILNGSSSSQKHIFDQYLVKASLIPSRKQSIPHFRSKSTSINQNSIQSKAIHSEKESHQQSFRSKSVNTTIKNSQNSSSFISKSNSSNPIVKNKLPLTYLILKLLHF